MRLKTVVFYQGVKLWDGNLFQTVHEGDGNRNNKGVTISLENHVVTLECEGKSEIIIVGTSNMREARYWREPSPRLPTPKEMESFNRESKRPDTEHGNTLAGISSTESGLSSKEVGVLGSPESGDQAGNPSDAAENDGGAAPVTPAFDPKKYAGKTAEPKVTKPSKAKKGDK